MIEAMAGMIMAAKVHFAEMKYPFIKGKDRVVAESIYQNKVNKIEELERYEKSKLPESGYMTVAEYEDKSRAKSKIVSLAAAFCFPPPNDSLITFSVSGEIASRIEHTPDTGASKKIMATTARKPARHPAQTRCLD